MLDLADPISVTYPATLSCRFRTQARILEVLDNVCSVVPQSLPLDSKKGKKIVNDAVQRTVHVNGNSIAYTIT